MRSSLFLRLLTTQLLVVTLALLAVGFSLSYLYTDYIFDLKEQELTKIGSQLARELRDPTPGSLTRLSMLLNAAYIYGDTSVWIADNAGRIILPQEAVGLKLGDAETQQMLLGKTIAWQTVWKEQNESVFTVAVPVRTPQGVSGAVIINSPMRGIMSTVNDARRFIFWSGVLAVSLAAFFSYLSARAVAGPLQEMRGVAIDMSRGDFARRVVVKGDDEVAELALAVNDMAGRLGSTIKALGEEKAKTELVVAGLSEGVLALDSSGKVHLVNNAARQLLHPMQLEIGGTLSVGEPANSWSEALQQAFTQTLAGDGSRLITIQRADRIIQVQITPLSAGDENGAAEEIVGAVALLRDVSEAERLEKMRRDFVADVSHELRTPLTSIRGFAQAILDNVVTAKDDVRRYLSVIMDESMRLMRLTNTLLDLSRMESHHIKLMPTAVSIQDVVADALFTLEPLFSEKSVQAEVDAPPDLPLVTADPDRLEQVLVNLLDNAVRHAPENGLVKLSARKTTVPTDTGVLQDWLEIAVSDNGGGIPPAELPFIWERFYKVDKARRQNRSGGTGLGLVIVKQLVELHNGTVQAENLPEGGACFTVRLPLTPAVQPFAADNNQSA